MNKQITINGKKYDIDIEKAVKDGYLNPVATRHVGQFYRFRSARQNPEIYILAHVEYKKVALICLSNDGNRYADPIEVDNLSDISDKEWSSISSNVFALVTKPFSIKPRKR